MRQDINTYFTRIKVEAWEGKPVTLHHLLTRKSARLQESQVPLGDFLAENLPKRIGPPGEVFSYSSRVLHSCGSSGIGTWLAIVSNLM